MRCPTLTDLPPPPKGKTGWPWTRETPRVPESMPDGKPWPRISIVTPSYNQGQFIEETIRSVLLQGYPDLEYIIIDGGSTDESVEIIRKYERWITFWVSEPDSGQTNAINKGFKRSTGEIVAWLNSDDVYTAGALCTAAKAFAEQPHVAVIYGDADTIDAGTTILSNLNSRDFDLQELYHRDYIRQPASFISADAIKKIGFLDERFHYAMDYDLWICLGQEGNVMQYIPRTLAWFRLHGSSKSVSQQEAFWPEIFLVFDKVLTCRTPGAPLTEIAYSRILQSLLINHLSQQPHKIVRCTSKGMLDDGNGEMFYQKPLQEVLRFVDKDHFHAGDSYLLMEALHEIYKTLENEYNMGKISPSIGSKPRWVYIQLALLPGYLLLLGERTKSVGLYKTILYMHPFLLKYPQTYRFPGRYVMKTNPMFKKILKNLRSSRVFYGIRSIFFGSAIGSY